MCSTRARPTPCRRQRSADTAIDKQPFDMPSVMARAKPATRPCRTATAVRGQARISRFQASALSMRWPYLTGHEALIDVLQVGIAEIPNSHVEPPVRNTVVPAMLLRRRPPRCQRKWPRRWRPAAAASTSSCRFGFRRRHGPLARLRPAPCTVGRHVTSGPGRRAHGLAAPWIAAGGGGGDASARAATPAPAAGGVGSSGLHPSQSSVIRLALPPAAAVLTLSARSVNSASSAKCAAAGAQGCRRTMEPERRASWSATSCSAAAVPW